MFLPRQLNIDNISYINKFLLTVQIKQSFSRIKIRSKARKRKRKLKNFRRFKESNYKITLYLPMSRYIVMSTRENINFVQKFGKYNIT